MDDGMDGWKGRPPMDRCLETNVTSLKLHIPSKSPAPAPHIQPKEEDRTDQGYYILRYFESSTLICIVTNGGNFGFLVLYKMLEVEGVCGQAWEAHHLINAKHSRRWGCTTVFFIISFEKKEFYN
jgi:hypothetical protein